MPPGPAPTDLAPVVFNTAVLEQFTFGNQGLKQRLVTSFLEHAPSMRQALRGAAAAGLGAWLEQLHRARGSCHLVGAERLRDALAAAEQLARTGQADQSLRMAGQLVEEIDQLVASLSHWMAVHEGGDVHA